MGMVNMKLEVFELAEKKNWLPGREMADDIWKWKRKQSNPGR